MSVPYGFEKVGYIDVDAGLVAVGDPCYTTGRDASSAVESWDEYLNKLNEVGMFRSTEEKEFGQPYDHKGASFVTNTLYGDGTYPVYVKHDTNFFGKRGVAGIFIDFSDDSDDEEDDDNSFGDLDDGLGVYEDDE